MVNYGRVLQFLHKLSINVMPCMKRYPMVEMELLAWRYRGHIREQKKTNHYKIRNTFRDIEFYWKILNQNIYTMLEKIPMLWSQRRSRSAHEAIILFNISALAGV